MDDHTRESPGCSDKADHSVNINYEYISAMVTKTGGDDDDDNCYTNDLPCFGNNASEFNTFFKILELNTRSINSQIIHSSSKDEATCFSMRGKGKDNIILDKNKITHPSIRDNLNDSGLINEMRCSSMNDKSGSHSSNSKVFKCSNDNKPGEVVLESQDIKSSGRKMELLCSEDNTFDEKLEDKIRKCREKADTRKKNVEMFSSMQIDHAKIIVYNEVEKIKCEWPALFGGEPDSIYVHVDLDAFYASCEILTNPSLKGLPIAVGDSNMLATSSYEARKYGVKAGMPGYKAKRLCPQLIIVPCDHVKYNSYSQRVMKVLCNYDSNLEIYGTDEACLVFDEEKLKAAFEYSNTDKTNQNKNTINLTFENIERLVSRIRHNVFKNTGLTISAGISVCRGLSKLCSDINKPNGQFTLKDNHQSFLNALKVDKMNGIGKYTKTELEKTFNVKTIGNLKDNMHFIYLGYKQKTFVNLLRLSHGLISFDNHPCFDKKGTQGIARDFSFPSSDSYSFLCETIWFISKELNGRLLTSNMSLAQTITLKIRFKNFVSVSKQKKLRISIQKDVDIFNAAYDLFTEFFGGVKNDSNKIFCLDMPINLIGIRLTNLFCDGLYNQIFKFGGDVSFNYNGRRCTICNEELMTLTEIGYEKHVLNCIRNMNRKDKNVKKSILDYIKD